MQANVIEESDYNETGKIEEKGVVRNEQRRKSWTTVQNFYGQTKIYLQFKYYPDCSILELGQSILHLQLHLSLLLDTNIFVFNNFAQLFYVVFLLTIIFLIIFTLNHINRINTYIELNNLNSLQSSHLFFIASFFIRHRQFFVSSFLHYFPAFFAV